jgi:predicted HicB family RNase H-like nuclease
VPSETKSKRPGRPRMAGAEAKAKVVVVRLTVADHKRATIAAKALRQTISQWIRDMVNAALQP